MKCGRTIKKLRKARKLTLTELSRQSRIQLSTLSRMENNLITGSLWNHAKLADVFGLKLSQLFEEYEKADASN